MSELNLSERCDEKEDDTEDDDSDDDRMAMSAAW